MSRAFSELTLHQNFTPIFTLSSLRPDPRSGLSRWQCRTTPAEGKNMRIGTGKFVSAMGGLVLALASVPNALAACGGPGSPMLQPTSWQPQYGQMKLLRASLPAPNGHDSYDDDKASIVGFWHVKFVSDGISSGIPGGVPKGAPVDAGYSQWHSDGTEIMNSGGRAPNTGDFCLGVWAQVGPRQYKLNHFAASWDPTKGELDSAGNPVGALVGPANIKELVTLSPDGNSFVGTFSIDQYDEERNHLAHLEGTITGTRITVNTPPSSVF